MYIHIGQNTMLLKKNIIGIFDLDNTSQSFLTRKFLSDAEKAGNVINVSDDIPKSFVVYQDGAKQTVYLSQLNSTTLLKRNESVL